MDCDEVIAKIIDFAIEHPEVLAVYTGNNPEEENWKGYFFLTGSNPVTNRFEDEVTELEWIIANTYNTDSFVMKLPITPKELDRAEAWGLEKCLYEKAT